MTHICSIDYVNFKLQEQNNLVLYDHGTLKRVTTQHPPLKANCFSSFSLILPNFEGLYGPAFNTMVRMTHFCPTTHRNTRTYATLKLHSLVLENNEVMLISLHRDCKNRSWEYFLQRKDELW